MSCDAYFKLMRFDKPIGILLLLWPTMWALWTAAPGIPSLKNIFIFSIGVILMRAAGCVINDIADRHVDSQVVRTKMRPITSGIIPVKNAVILFSLLCVLAFVLVLFTNALTILLSVCALCVAILYPFAKRYTYWPQTVLGLAFSFSIPMAFAAETNNIPPIAYVMMLANIAWTIAYDTEYAMTDRADDIRAGIKSTAILFAQHDRQMIGLFQGLALLILFLLGWIKQFSLAYFIALLIAGLFFVYQQILIAKREAENCFRAFLNNQWVGLVIFIGVLFR